jgi:hypothetical protein
LQWHILIKKNKNFELAVDYFEMVGNYTFEDGETTRKKLKLNSVVSMWDILATYLILYRFPLLFTPENNGTKVKLLSYYRFLKGITAHKLDKLKSMQILATKTNRSIIPNSNNENIRNILFLGFKDIYFRDILSFIHEELNNKKSVLTYVINQKKSSKNDNLNGYSLWSLLTKEDYKFVNFFLRENEKLKKVLLDKKFINEISFYKNYNINKTLLKNELAWILYREIPRLAPFIALAKKLFSKNFPSLLVTADDADQKCRVFSLYAKTKKIDTLVVQQGLVRKDYPEWVYFSGSKVACIGKYSKEIINSQGVPSQRIILTGSVEMDKYFKEGIKGYNLFNINKTNKKPKILFASQPYVHGAFASRSKRKLCISQVYSELSKVTEIADILIKPHPNENSNDLKKNKLFF